MFSQPRQGTGSPPVCGVLELDRREADLGHLLPRHQGQPQEGRLLSGHEGQCLTEQSE